MRWLVIVGLCACGGDKTPPPPSTGSAVVPHAIDAQPEAPLPVATGSDGVPLVCGEWKAAIDKLETCTAIPQNARDSLIAVYKDASRDWGQLPADAKRNLITVCRAGADSVLKGAKATCGW
ncbi:MAG: hypothetical protein ABI591_33305 [Kofleriaceae bacterium]